MRISLDGGLRAVIAGVCMCGAFVSAWGGVLKAEEAFTGAPRRVIPLLDENARLDMLDYYRSNMSTGTLNEMGGRSRVTSAGTDEVTARLSDASVVQVAVVREGERDYVAVINTVEVPWGDSRMSVYTEDWGRDVTGRVWSAPVMEDWLTEEGRKHRGEAEVSVPFMLVGYRYDADGGELVLTNNTGRMLGEEVYGGMSGWFYPELRYVFKGGRFVRL